MRIRSKVLGAGMALATAVTAAGYESTHSSAEMSAPAGMVWPIDVVGWSRVAEDPTIGHGPSFSIRQKVGEACMTSPGAVVVSQGGKFVYHHEGAWGLECRDGAALEYNPIEGASQTDRAGVTDRERYKRILNLIKTLPPPDFKSVRVRFGWVEELPDDPNDVSTYEPTCRADGFAMKLGEIGAGQVAWMTDTHHRGTICPYGVTFIEPGD